MISTFTMEAGLVIAALMAVVGVVQWKRQSGRQQQEKYILDYAGASFGIRESEERRRTAAETGRRKEAERPLILAWTL